MFVATLTIPVMNLGLGLETDRIKQVNSISLTAI